MGINMKLMEDKKKEANKDGKLWFRPENDKDYKIRILPDVDEDPFREFYMHYNVGKGGKGGGFVCPNRQYDEECKVCDVVRGFYDSQIDENVKAARSIGAKPRYYSQIIVREGNKDVKKLWSYSKTIYKELLNYVTNPEYGDITDPDEGLDMTLRRTMKENGFPEISLIFNRKSSPMIAEGDVEEFLSDIPVIKDELAHLTQEEIGKRLEDYLSSAEEKDEVDKYGDDDSGGDNMKDKIAKAKKMKK